MMGKQRIFTITFWVWTVLSFCTAVSFKIQDLMRNEVVIENPEMSKDRMIQKIPASAVLEQEAGTGIYVIESKMGIGGEEKCAKFEVASPAEYEGKQAVFIAETELKNVIIEAVYPVEEDMIVEPVEKILTKEEAVREAKGQKENLQLLVVAGIGAFLLAIVAERCIKRIFERKYRRCIVGMLLIFIAGMLLYVCMGKVDIPRTALPEECIFDWEFYRETFF